MWNIVYIINWGGKIFLHCRIYSGNQGDFQFSIVDFRFRIFFDIQNLTLSPAYNGPVMLPKKPDFKTQKFAFVQKNFKNLSFEMRIIFLTHALTILFCFFPWISVEPLYESPYWNSGFFGPSGMIGLFIFLFSLSIVVLFADKILETKRITLPFPERHLFVAVGAQQLLLIVLAWSVLVSISRDFEVSEIRFGILLAFLAQILGLVAAQLQTQKDKKQKVMDFFQPPAHPVHKGAVKSEPMGGLFQGDENDNNLEE